MHADNSRHLAAAQERRHQELVERTSRTLRRLDREGAEITFVAVASAAGVSRAFLYKTPSLCEEIVRLRRPRPTPAQRVPAAHRRSEASKDATASRLQEDNRQLRTENIELRRANEALLGRLREGPKPATSRASAEGVTA